jgi:hypothetical protein
MLLIVLATFTLSWFPLLYVEIIEVEDSGSVFLISIIVNICCMYFGMFVMLKLMREIALDTIE